MCILFIGHICHYRTNQSHKIAICSGREQIFCNINYLNITFILPGR